MIIDRGKIQISTGVEYITQWVDSDGQFEFDKFLGNGKLIVNKKVTGCGFTTYCLINSENCILVSPRIRLIKGKLERFNQEENVLFYFNREKKKGKKQKPIEKLICEFRQYIQDCEKCNRPLKILVTYDSFSILAKMLERVFEYDISRVFRIAVDESHTLIKDVQLKEYCNKCVLSNLLQSLFHYDKLLFISATPIISYIRQIQQFMEYDVDYVELDFPNVSPVTVRQFGCKNASDAFDQIYTTYSKHQDQEKRHYFDAIHYGEGRTDYSYEAVIFLNSIMDIKRIVNKYVNKLSLIDIADINVICSDSDENQTELHKVHSKLNVADRIPMEGENHKTWTFVTRTAFEGVDFCSSCASTFVVANYNVQSLALDIASDIPQIIGRQRVKANVFRNTLHIYYTKNLSILNDDEFQAWQNEKMQISRQQIALWENTNPELKDLCLSNITCAIERRPNAMYVKTVNGIPEIDPLLLLSENYCQDIMKNHVTWYSIQSPDSIKKPLSPVVLELKEKMLSASSPKKTQERIMLVLDCSVNHPECLDEIFRMLHDEGYNDIAYYFNILSPNRIMANGCDPWKIEQEIKQREGAADVKDLVSSVFEVGKVYSKKEVKSMLQEVYDKMGVRKTAKANELPKYINCRETKKDGLKAYKIE